MYLYKAATIAALLIASAYTAAYIHSEYRDTVTHSDDRNIDIAKWCYTQWANSLNVPYKDRGFTWNLDSKGAVGDAFDSVYFKICVNDLRAY